MQPGYFLAVVLAVLASGEAVAQASAPIPEGELLPPGVARMLIKPLLADRVWANGNYLWWGDTVTDERSIALSTAKLGWMGVPKDRRKVQLEFGSLAYFTVSSSEEKYYSLKEQKTKKGTIFLVASPTQGPLDAQFFAWEKETDAKRFREVMNGLIYAAKRDPVADWNAFVGRAKEWREKRIPAVLSDASDRHRILAEQKVRDADQKAKEKDIQGSKKELMNALIEYEAGLQAHEMWPEGWFNAALLYAELEEFAGAADRMKHYLELVPDAPDAKAAREKMIVWESKVRQ